MFTCPECATPQTGRFCDSCGYDFMLAHIDDLAQIDDATAVSTPLAEQPPLPEAASAKLPTGPSIAAEIPMPRAAPPVWRLIVTADLAYHARMQAQAPAYSDPIPFPAFVPERRFELTGQQLLIGRRSRSRGIDPEIDLSGPPIDPAVSHAHALLVAQPAGGWCVVDLQSSNGTYLGNSESPLAAHSPVPLSDGDVIHVGAWTALTLQRM